MQKLIVLVLAVTVIMFYGCKAKSDAPQAGAAGDRAAQMQPGASSGGAGQHANPHAGMGQAVSAGADHKGKVVSTMDAAGYTYMEVEEQGQKLWVAVMQTTVKKGDEVEFPDAPPMQNFHSKTLNRTFDKIILAPALRINGKPVEMGAHPQTKQ